MKISLFNYLHAWLHFTNNNFPTLTSVEEILDQPIVLKPQNKLDVNSDNPYFYCIPPTNVSDKFTVNRDLCKFIRPGLLYNIYPKTRFSKCQP